MMGTMGKDVKKAMHWNLVKEMALAKRLQEQSLLLEWISTKRPTG
jgi:hypothetical protein